MFYFNKIDRSFSEENLPILGRSIPSLLDEACDRFPNSQGLNQWHNNGCDSQSNQEFRLAAEELALGLQTTDIASGDRVALLMHSGIDFLLADLGSLLAGTVNVPIDLTQTLENIAFILSHSETKVLIVSNLDLLAQIIPYLEAHSHLHTVIVVDVPDNWQQKKHELLTCEEISTAEGSKIVCQVKAEGRGQRCDPASAKDAREPRTRSWASRAPLGDGGVPHYSLLLTLYFSRSLFHFHHRWEFVLR